MKKAIPHIFVFLTFCLTMSLSIWQVQRLNWKEELIEKLDTRLKLPPISAADFKSIESSEFRLIQEQGQFNYALAMQVLHQGYNGKLGTHLLVPFTTTAGKTILVNRGWVPYETDYEKSQPTELYGVIRKSPRLGHFALQNEPDKNLWYNIDLDKMYNKLKLENPSYYVEEQAKEAAQEHEYPIPLPKKIEIYNEHLQYAITWFGMSIALLAVYYFRFFHKRKAKK